MRGFRFRAQAALDLRRREYDMALRDLARAEQAREQARERLAAADAGVARALRDADAAAARATSFADLQWYRFWILRLDRERVALVSALVDRDDDVARASAACLRAQQRCKALERFREKALATHLAAEAVVERKLIDETAAQRFAARRNEMEGAV